MRPYIFKNLPMAFPTKCLKGDNFCDWLLPLATQPFQKEFYCCRKDIAFRGAHSSMKVLVPLKKEGKQGIIASPESVPARRNNAFPSS